ncbi:4164_t:CDS:2 [Dentiscutata erythropus]|uniref:DNA-directed RNA polymerase II subunit RPB9 n=1 Tax=Dentiscutata erythropus TaxID=1348616 RepID=A0A9N9EEV8_9GLOM|nr:4164_t:CDS:2 [Dentiscutata erythropus]
MATFKFCSQCNLLYPKEDKETQRLLYACRNCIYQEETKNYCVYRNEISNIISDKTTIIKDLAADPSLAKKTCSQCGFTVAVYFQAQARRGDSRMTLYYACGNSNCGYRWTDFESSNADFDDALQDEEYEDQDYQSKEDYDLSNQFDDPSFEDPSYPTDNVESEAIDTSAPQYQHNPEDW